jgi:hypothetical protein
MTEAENVVERVSAALRECLGPIVAIDDPELGTCLDSYVSLPDLARAAIEAMRDAALTHETSPPS